MDSKSVMNQAEKVSRPRVPTKQTFNFGGTPQNPNYQQRESDQQKSAMPKFTHDYLRNGEIVQINTKILVQDGQSNSCGKNIQEQKNFFSILQTSSPHPGLKFIKKQVKQKMSQQHSNLPTSHGKYTSQIKKSQESRPLDDAVPERQTDFQQFYNKTFSSTQITFMCQSDRVSKIQGSNDDYQIAKSKKANVQKNNSSMDFKIKSEEAEAHQPNSSNQSSAEKINQSKEHITLNIMPPGQNSLQMNGKANSNTIRTKDENQDEERSQQSFSKKRGSQQEDGVLNDQKIRCNNVQTSLRRISPQKLQSEITQAYNFNTPKNMSQKLNEQNVQIKQSQQQKVSNSRQSTSSSSQQQQSKKESRVMIFKGNIVDQRESNLKLFRDQIKFINPNQPFLSRAGSSSSSLLKSINSFSGYVMQATSDNNFRKAQDEQNQKKTSLAKFHASSSAQKQAFNYGELTSKSSTDQKNQPKTDTQILAKKSEIGQNLKQSNISPKRQIPPFPGSRSKQSCKGSSQGSLQSRTPIHQSDKLQIRDQSKDVKDKTKTSLNRLMSSDTQQAGSPSKQQRNVCQTPLISNFPLQIKSDQIESNSFSINLTSVQKIKDNNIYDSSLANHKSSSPLPQIQTDNNDINKITCKVSQHKILKEEEQKDGSILSIIEDLNLGESTIVDKDPEEKHFTSPPPSALSSDIGQQETIQTIINQHSRTQTCTPFSQELKINGGAISLINDMKLVNSKQVPEDFTEIIREVTNNNHAQEFHRYFYQVLMKRKNLKQVRNIYSGHALTQQKKSLEQQQESKDQGKPPEATATTDQQKDYSALLRGLISDIKVFEAYEVDQIVDQAQLENFPIVSAKAWCISDGKKGAFIDGKEQTSQREMASLTKIMTAYTVCRLLSDMNINNPKNVYLRVSRKAAYMNGTTAFLKADQRISIYDCLHALLLPSGNDAAVVLATCFGKWIYYSNTQKKKTLKNAQTQGIRNGSIIDNDIYPPVSFDTGHEDYISCFVQEMNRQAKKMKLDKLNFSNPHGLQEKANHASPQDLCIITSHAIKYDLFKEVVNKKQHDCTVISRLGEAVPYSWTNSNKLLNNFFLGVKTGVTPTAGPCLCCEFKYEEFHIIVCIMDAKNVDIRWKEMSTLVLWALDKHFKKNNLNLIFNQPNYINHYKRGSTKL